MFRCLLQGYIFICTYYFFLIITCIYYMIFFLPCDSFLLLTLCQILKIRGMETYFTLINIGVSIVWKLQIFVLDFQVTAALLLQALFY